jgi:glutamate-1-semialdehyde 2,1-aminomutase
MKLDNSINEFKLAQEVIPGGVNSPVRAFKSVHCSPIFISKAKGSKIFDIDGNEYIDFVSSWGPMILGHAHDDVLYAINTTAANGTSYGAPTRLETLMAQKIISMIPSVEKVRMVNSGTEATMSAIRLARGFTKKEAIIKFSGNYHGHGDSFLIKAGSGALTLGLPDSPGVTKNTAKDTLIAEYNDLDSVEKLLKEKIDGVAAIIVEPVAGNMGLVLPNKTFLQGLRDLSDKYNCVLIFDEVMTGFRLAPGGAQEYYNVKADLTTLGKIIGGGLPVGAYGGKKEIMDFLAPNGPVYQAGTLSGNPLAMSAGLTVLNKLDYNFYAKLESISSKIHQGLLSNIKETNTNAIVNRNGSMLTLFFTDLDGINNYEDAIKCDTEKFADYFQIMLEQGIYLPPSPYECLFFSSSLDDNDINKFINANKIALEKLKK